MSGGFARGGESPFVCCCASEAGLCCSSPDAEPAGANAFLKLWFPHRNADNVSAETYSQDGCFANGRLLMGVSMTVVLNQG